MKGSVRIVSRKAKRRGDAAEQDLLKSADAASDIGASKTRSLSGGEMHSPELLSTPAQLPGSSAQLLMTGSRIKAKVKAAAAAKADQDDSWSDIVES